nr:306_t:CDS:2 [Entrophospora candida]
MNALKDTIVTGVVVTASHTGFSKFLYPIPLESKSESLHKNLTNQTIPHYIKDLDQVILNLKALIKDLNIENINNKHIDQDKKKQPQDLREAQAKGELLIANSAVPLDVMVMLTDCNNKWSVFFIMKVESSTKKYCITNAKLMIVVGH